MSYLASFNEALLLHNTPLNSRRVQRDHDAPAGSLGEKWKKRTEEKRRLKEGTSMLTHQQKKRKERQGLHLLDAASENAENPVKLEERKRKTPFIGRLLARGHRGEAGWSSQSVKAAEDETKRGSTIG